jgi:phosphoglycerate kinase
LGEVESDDYILDIGPDTVKLYSECIKQAKTIIWNGPMGVFEFEAFAMGTYHVAKAVATSGAYSVLGGGETVSAVSKNGLEDKISFISTGGGAMLEFLEGKTLPGVAALD